MDKPAQVALAIADALLAGAPDVLSMMKNMSLVLGKKWPWIPSLCQKIELCTRPHLYHYSRHELADLILNESSFSNAWFYNKNPPSIKHYCLLPPIAPEKPAWLAVWGLPEFKNSSELANFLNLDLGELGWFADQWRDSPATAAGLQHYRYRWLAKRSGGMRLLEMPKQRLCNMQRKILQHILNRVPPHAAAQAFRQQHSCLSHARLHTGKQVVLRLDLKDFFSSIPGSRIHALFAKLGYPEQVAATLARLCTHRTPAHVRQEVQAIAQLPNNVRHFSNLLRSPHLPQGSPASPALANLCAYRMDMRLASLASSMQASYSRYADDLTFSGDTQFAHACSRFISQVGAIAMEEGFTVNHRKTRIMRAASRQQVTGIVVNQHCNIKRHDFDTMKAILTNCLRGEPEAQNRQQHPDFRRHLAGRLSHMQMLNPGRAAKLQAIFHQIKWPADVQDQEQEQEQLRT